MNAAVRSLFFLGYVFATMSVPALAQSDTTPSEDALSDSNWYDSETGEVVPIYVEPVVDDSLNRESRWLPRAKRVAKQTTTTTTGGGGGGGGGGTGLFGSGITFGNLFGWVLLIAIVAGGVAVLLYAFSKAEIELGSEGRSLPQQTTSPDEQTLERMKHLPAELRRTDVNLRSEAERLMNEGVFDQAIILLFAHQLLLLDRVGILRLNRGKTNGKYVRETRGSDPDLARRLRATVSAFEMSYFGRHDLSRERFVQLWDSNLKLEQAVQSRQELAA